MYAEMMIATEMLDICVDVDVDVDVDGAIVENIRIASLNNYIRLSMGASPQTPIARCARRALLPV